MNIDKKALIGIITEIENSRERAKAETRHQSEILKKAKEQNFDTKAIRKVLQRRAMSEADRDSLDLAIDTYERAMGSLATAQAAVDEGRMSGREAAEHFNVPRGALATVTRGPKNEISEPTPNPEDGDDGITDAALRAGAPLGIPQIAGVIPPSVKPDPESREGSGTHSDEAPATPSVGAVASESERVASSSDDDDLKPPPFLRGPSPANRRAV